METKQTRVTLTTATLLVIGSIAGQALGGPLFTIASPYRHFQHQKESGGTWMEAFDGCCFATSAGTVAMSIADNNAGISLQGFSNTSLGAESFEAQYSIGGTSGEVANGVNSAVPEWFDDGNWVNPPWFMGADVGKLRVMDFYLGGVNDNWASIPTTLPRLSVVGAFALAETVAPFMSDAEWWDYHVIGVYEFDFTARTMKFTDSNKDRAGAEFTTGGGHAVGGAILTGAGVLDNLTWTAAGIMTNNSGAGMDDERLVSLRVVYLIPEPSSAAVVVVFAGLGLVRARQS